MSHLPKGVPDSVQEAYEQACFLLAHSPRASGALSRYALQKIIRDFWQLPADQYGTIAQELDLVSGRLPPETQESIASVRGFGSIDAQLSQDRDLLVEATAGEAKLMIALVQLLSREWYEDRRRRQVHRDAIRAMAAETAQPLMRTVSPAPAPGTNGAHEQEAEATSAPEPDPPAIHPVGDAVEEVSPPASESTESAWRVESGSR
jgi:hypothetical protein